MAGSRLWEHSLHTYIYEGKAERPNGKPKNRKAGRTHGAAVCGGKFRSGKITFSVSESAGRGRAASGQKVSGDRAGAVRHADPEGAGVHERPGRHPEYRRAQLSAPRLPDFRGGGRRLPAGAGGYRENPGAAAGSAGAAEKSEGAGGQSGKAGNGQPDEIPGLRADAVRYQPCRGGSAFGGFHQAAGAVSQAEGCPGDLPGLPGISEGAVHDHGGNPGCGLRTGGQIPDAQRQRSGAGRIYRIYPGAGQTAAEASCAGQPG